MSEPKWTPGPWEIEETETGRKEGDEDIFIVGPDGETIAMMSRDIMIDETVDANACLIASAPDLIAALKDQAAWIERLLQAIEHRTVHDQSGNPINGFAFSPVPEWEMRQKLDSLREDIAKTEGSTGRA